ncbi:hypothetical protein DSL64_25805 [Dyadobacter luteus]|uniref:Uncharacterized protein n=1 Tax=Dyadobacter luteus TaxID=2259619 RepID=A0A3D8Y532_9BACT|nr:hypothetical protein DSL64_25805 [Dyadobacter luteus]
MSSVYYNSVPNHNRLYIKTLTKNIALKSSAIPHKACEAVERKQKMPDKKPGIKLERKCLLSL